jgi:8-amino-7-oxononanoate synthase
MGNAPDMNAFEDELEAELAGRRERGLYRRLGQVDSAQSPRVRLDGQELLNFASNDYLGLANHPALKQAAIAAVDRYGAGSGASRLICGSLSPHHELEETLASFKGTEAALAFSTGYGAALGTIGALMRNGDILIVDRLVHACVVDAARLCGATLRVFRHNELNHLEHLLAWAAKQGAGSPARPGEAKPRLLVVTESVFSMDGDQAPLREIVALKNRYGAWLMVDEAHATGLYGKRGRGLAEQAGVAADIEIQMGTLGKAAGAAGGFICGSRRLIDFLINCARSFIFSTAPVPASAAAAGAGIRLIQSETGTALRESLWQKVAKMSVVAAPAASPAASAIIPIHIGPEAVAVETAASLRQRGIFIPAIRYPTVARGRARLRLTLTAAHSEADLAELTAALKNLHLTVTT